MFSTSFFSVFPHYPVYESHLWTDPIPHAVVRSLEELDLVAPAVIAHAQQSDCSRRRVETECSIFHEF